MRKASSPAVQLTHPTHRRDLWSRLRERIGRGSPLRLVRWMKLGDAQQNWYLRRLMRIVPIDLVVDVGANEGQFATRMRRDVGYRGPIISVEPVPGIAERLKTRFADDRLWALADCALGDRSGRASMNVMRGHELSSLLMPTDATTDRLAAFNQIEHEVDVEVRTLDELLTDHPLARGCRNIYLKLDVQGYEEQVLAGAHGSLERISAMQAELSVIALYEGVAPYHALMRDIEAMGFQLSFVPAHNYTQVPDMIDFDCHFVSRRVLAQQGYLRSNVANADGSDVAVRPSA